MPSKRNFSAKRKAIYEVLAGSQLHPSAEWIYAQLKQTVPDLSLGTVYRNLNVFQEMGLIKSVGVINGQERFDANVQPHSHFICTRCYCIRDIPARKKFIDNISYDYVSNEFQARIDSHSICFYGLCRECLAAQQ